MRILALALLAGATLAMPARAQTYDPSYPVCLHVFGRATYFECRYTSFAQCNASASGRAAQCDANPYFAHAVVDGPTGYYAPRHYRHHHRHHHAY